MNSRRLVPLPIDEHVPGIVAAAREKGAVIVVAQPGAGKTTRVPPALLELGSVALLQPRRVAARSLARRIADERGLVLGEDVGWHVRFERRFSSRTRLLVMTEGILTARLQSDPLLSDFGVVVLDEFHERSIHADLALALARQARLARGDLRIVVMSATLEAAPVSHFLDDAPIVTVPGRAHPVSIEHRETGMAEAVRSTLQGPGGDVLCFLPGAGEIRRVADSLGGVAAEVLPLHGSLPPEEQDRALAPASRRKIVLATNVAETSLTVEGVTDVIDSGEMKVLRFDPSTGLDRLVLERIPQGSADQRAGRAGRTGPGRALRLWDPRLQLKPHLEPEIARIDLAAPFLDVLAWGGDPLAFDWFEAPPEDSARAAIDLLRRLGAMDGSRLGPLGERMRRLPLHPRLARVLCEARGATRAALACALLSERLPRRVGVAATTESDVLSLADDPARLPRGARDAARELAASVRRALGEAGLREDIGDDELRRALLAGFPDRVARRREPRSGRLLLASGTGAVLGEESGVRDAEWLLALDVLQPPRGGESFVRVASAVERAWLAPDTCLVEHRFDPAARRVRAWRAERLGVLLLSEREVEPEPGRASELLVQVLRQRGLGVDDEGWMRRARFAGIELDAMDLLAQACEGRIELPGGRLAELVPHALRAQVDRLAPDVLRVPSGRSLRLDYRGDGTVALEVKLQELFGLGESPRLGARGEPVLLELLSPAGRPVQSTRDLASFWERTYPEIRRELRARYPRHPWPEDPMSATPTHRTKPR